MNKEQFTPGFSEWFVYKDEHSGIILVVRNMDTISHDFETGEELYGMSGQIHSEGYKTEKEAETVAAALNKANGK
jgi:hypothetical protein